MSMFWQRRIQNSTLTKPQHFHEFFTQKINNFLGKSKLNKKWTKNEVFKQCGITSNLAYLIPQLSCSVCAKPSILRPIEQHHNLHSQQ